MPMKEFLSNLFNNKITKIFLVVYGLLSIIVLIVFADSLLCKDSKKDNLKLYLDKGWDITINSDHYTNVDLNSFKFPSVDKGTSIMMEYQLPEDWDFENPALTFHVRHSTVKMYSEWHVFYKYGHERLAENKTVGSGIQIVNFSNDYKGTTLRILLTVTEKNAFSRFDSIYLSEWNDAQHITLTENRIALFAGSFLVVLGIVVATITVIGTVFSKRYASLIWLSSFSIFMGFWTLCYHNIVIIFSIPTYSTSLLEYMCIMMAPIPLLAYLYAYVASLKNKIIDTVYKLLFVIQFLLSVITIALHLSNTLTSLLNILSLRTKLTTSLRLLLLLIIFVAFKSSLIKKERLLQRKRGLITEEKKVIYLFILSIVN